MSAMVDCGWSKSIPTKCRRSDCDNIALIPVLIEKMPEPLLTHYPLKEADHA